jgi:hypothetical protein
MYTPGRRNRLFFHRPHTSNGKSTSSALLEDDVCSVKSGGGLSKEDPGPSVGWVSPDDVFAPRPVVASPPLSPLVRSEFKAQYILSPSKLHDHLKEAIVPPPPPPVSPPVEVGLRSPHLEPSRGRSNTTTTAVTTTTTDTSGSHRSVMSTHSSDSPAQMRQLLPPRRIHNTSLPAMALSQPVEQPRRFVRSVSTVSQPSTATAPGPPPPPRSLAALGLLPPPRGRVGMQQPIVSFISSRSLPTPRGSEVPGAGLKHQSSRESCESQLTVRRERSMPLRDGPVSFLDIEVEEEESCGEEDDVVHAIQPWRRPTLQHSQSFLDLSSRQSGDTMRENDAMFA